MRIRAGRRYKTYLIAGLIAAGCGDRKPTEPLPDAATVTTATAERLGGRVNLRFTLSEPSERILVERRTDRNPSIRIFQDFRNDPRTEWSIVDSTIYSGMTHEYRVVPSKFPSEWISVSVPGTELFTSVSPGFGVVNLAWETSPAGIESFKVVRTTDGSQTVLARGPGGIGSLSEMGLEIGRRYLYQVVSTLPGGEILLSKVSEARIYGLKLEGKPSLAGFGNGQVIDILNGLPVMVFPGFGGVAVASVNGARTFNLIADFVDDQAVPEINSVSSLWVPPDQGVERSVHYAVAGLTQETVRLRAYSSGGSVVRELSWPRSREDRRTHLAIGSSNVLKRDVVFVTAGNRIWEVGDSFQDAPAGELPDGVVAGLAVVDGHLHVAYSDPPRMIRGRLEDAASARSVAWQTVPLPSGARPISIASVATRRDRLWILDDEQRLHNMNGQGDTVSFVRLPDAGPRPRSIFTARTGYGGVAVMCQDGSVQLYGI